MKKRGNFQVAACLLSILFFNQKTRSSNYDLSSATITSTSLLKKKSIDWEEVREREIKLPTPTGSSKKQESSRKTYISALFPALEDFSTVCCDPHS